MNHPDLMTQTLFCEYAKTDADGMVSLIGIFPDNVNFTPPSGGGFGDADMQVPAIPNFSMYSRNRLPLDRQIKGPISVKFLSPSGQVLAGHTFETQFVNSSFQKALDQGQEYVTLIAQISFQNLGIAEEGPYTTVIEYGGEAYFSGRINMMFGEASLGSA